MQRRKIQVILNPKIGRFLRETRKRINLVYGGAGSGKSYTIAQFLIIEKFIKEKDKRILTVRKTLPALRITAYQLVLDLLKQYKIPFEQNKSEMTLKFGGNLWLFKSLDDPEKIKSYEGNYCWIEEATEITHEDFLQLNLRLRRHTDTINQMFLSFNPISKLNWIYKELIEKPRDDVACNRTTYKDNPFLKQEYVRELEALKGQDETFYQVYTLGQWGVLQNTIYSNWEVKKDWPEEFDEVIYGLDFGYNNPSALIEIGIRDKEYYLKELLYQSNLTNAALIQKLFDLKIDKKTNIYADASEPQRIEEIRREGFNIYPCEKGKDSVRHGIDYCKRQKLWIHPESTNLIAELQSYKWKEDKDGNVLDEPVKFKDHACDAFRYAIYTHRHEPFNEFIFVDF